MTKKIGRPKGSKNKPKQFCVHGHDTFLTGRTKGGFCKECNRKVQKKYKDEHQEEIKQEYADNKDKYISRAKKRYEVNREEILMYHTIYYEDNKKAILEYHKQHRLDFPEIERLSSIKKDEKRGKRVVTWGQKGVRKFYINCPKDMQVDHIIPLLGRLVSGLHVRWNLQYLTPHDNYVKHNKVNLIEISEWYGKILNKAGLK